MSGMENLLCALPAELWYHHILREFTCVELLLHVAPVCSYLRDLVEAIPNCHRQRRRSIHQHQPTLTGATPSPALRPGCATRLEHSLWTASEAGHEACRRRALARGARWSRAMITQVCAEDDLGLFALVVMDLDPTDPTATELGHCVAQGRGVRCAKAFHSLCGEHFLDCVGVLRTALRQDDHDRFLEHVLHPDMLPVLPSNATIQRRRRSVEEQLALAGGLKWLRRLQDMGHALDHRAILGQALSSGQLDVAAFAYAGAGHADDRSLLWAW